MIRAQKLRREYQSGGEVTQVLKGIDLEIKTGEFVAIIGPSGAGKSTLLYQLSLLDQPTSGSVFIDEQEASALSESEKVRFRLNNFGFIFQDYSLVPELTAMENVIVPGLMLAKNRFELEFEAGRLFKDLEIEHVKNHLPNQMSGGEQQRVSILRAILSQPKILFADEPTASLDSRRSEEVIEILLKLHTSGQTIVMVTHELEFAEKAQRIIHLKDGRVS